MDYCLGLVVCTFELIFGWVCTSLVFSAPVVGCVIVLFDSVDVSVARVI